MNFKSTSDFDKEFKKLEKKFRSLQEDLKELKKVLSVVPKRINKHFAVLHEWNGYSLLKARFACKYLHREPRLRIIYSYHSATETIEFIEIYFKGEKENEDRARIQRYIKENS